MSVENTRFSKIDSKRSSCISVKSISPKKWETLSLSPAYPPPSKINSTAKFTLSWSPSTKKYSSKSSSKRRKTSKKWKCSVHFRKKIISRSFWLKSSRKQLLNECKGSSRSIKSWEIINMDKSYTRIWWRQTLRTRISSTVMPCTASKTNSNGQKKCFHWLKCIFLSTKKIWKLGSSIFCSWWRARQRKTVEKLGFCWGNSSKHGLRKPLIFCLPVFCSEICFARKVFQRSIWSVLNGPSSSRAVKFKKESIKRIPFLHSCQPSKVSRPILSLWPRKTETISGCQCWTFLWI